MEPCPQSAEARAERSKKRASDIQKAKLTGDSWWDPMHNVAAAECDDTKDLDYPVEVGDDPNDYYYQVRLRLQRLRANGAKMLSNKSPASVSMSGKTPMEQAAIIGGVGLVAVVLGVGGWMLYKRYYKH